MSHDVIGTVTYMDDPVPPPGRFWQDGTVPKMLVLGDNARTYEFRANSIFHVGDRVRIDDGNAPILLGPAR